MTVQKKRSSSTRYTPPKSEPKPEVQEEQPVETPVESAAEELFEEVVQIEKSEPAPPPPPPILEIVPTEDPGPRFLPPEQTAPVQKKEKGVKLPATAEKRHPRNTPKFSRHK